MISYKVTVYISKDRESEWLRFMKQHIVHVLNTRHFVDVNFTKIVTVLDEMGSKHVSSEDLDYSNYIIEYFLVNRKELNAYLANGSAKLQKEHRDLFDGHFTVERDIREIEDVIKDLYMRPSQSSTSTKNPADVVYEEVQPILPFEVLPD